MAREVVRDSMLHGEPPHRGKPLGERGDGGSHVVVSNGILQKGKKFVEEQGEVTRDRECKMHTLSGSSRRGKED